MKELSMKESMHISGGVTHAEAVLGSGVAGACLGVACAALEGGHPLLMMWSAGICGIAGLAGGLALGTTYVAGTAAWSYYS